MNDGSVTEDNTATVRRCLDEIWNVGLLDRIDALIDPGFLCHNARNQDEDLHGAESFRALAAEIRAAIPDMHLSIEQMLAENDRVMVHVRGEGTHHGNLGGIAGSGRHLSWTATAIARLAGGRIAECWVIVDELGVLQQLGVVATQP